MNLASKIEYLLAAYLKAKAWPDYFSADDFILAGESDLVKEGQCIICACLEADGEEPAYSGNFWHPIQIELHTPVDLDGSDPTPLEKHRAVAAALETALLVDNLPAELNTLAASLGIDALEALAAFTCLSITDRQPIHSQLEDVYVAGLNARIYAAGASL